MVATERGGEKGNWGMGADYGGEGMGMKKRG